jgi:hypothetical protein
MGWGAPHGRNSAECFFSVGKAVNSNMFAPRIVNESPAAFRVPGGSLSATGETSLPRELSA